jgi:hypothetical protein
MYVSKYSPPGRKLFYSIIKKRASVRSLSLWPQLCALVERRASKDIHKDNMFRTFSGVCHPFVSPLFIKRLCQLEQ